MTHEVKVAVIVVIGAVLVSLLSGCAVDPVEELSRKIESPRVASREQAILQLSNLRDRRAIELLAVALAGDEELCDQTAVALVKHGRCIEAGQETNPVVERVTKVANNAHIAEQFRARAVWVLGEIGDRRARPVLQQVGQVGDVTKPVMTQQATEALEKLGCYSIGRPYELPMGTLSEDLPQIPELSQMQPPPE